MDKRSLANIIHYDDRYELATFDHNGQRTHPSTFVQWPDLSILSARNMSLTNNTRLRLRCASHLHFPTVFPDCKALEIKVDWVGRADFPEAILHISSLEELDIDVDVTFTRVPSSLRVQKLCMSCVEPPYWLIDSVPDLAVYIKRRLMRTYALRHLKFLLLMGLQLTGKWNRWLTKGLYDPRLLFKLRDFLL